MKRFTIYDLRFTRLHGRGRVNRKSPILNLLLVLIALLSLLHLLAQDTAGSKSRAYELYQQRRYEESAENFRRYLDQNPEDAQAKFDYASLLSQLGRHAEAAKLFEAIHEKNPRHEPAYFKLGVEYVNLKRHADAEKIFAQLEKSSNRDMADAATDAARRLKADLAREARFEAEEKVYDLARSFKYSEVVAAVNDMEQQREVSFVMAMQRLYSLASLRQYALALDLTDKLAAGYPKATDLALVRADLLAQLGRPIEAIAIWRRIARENAGTPAAAEAGRRIEVISAPAIAETQVKPPEPVKPAKAAEARVFELADKQRHREVVAAIDELEKQQGELSWTMEMQRLYALQALGETSRAAKLAEELAAAHPKSAELAVLRADLLIHERRWEEAGKVLKQIKRDNPDTPVAKEAEQRLLALPPIANLDKWYWGEAYVSGDYLGRYGTVVGSGFIRHGTYIPNARWLQPYAATRFTVDTRSGAGPRQSIIADNSVSLFAGARAQPFATEYFFAYIEGGLNKDLLDRRNNGDWAGDFQAGLYGYKSWGPGTIFKSVAGEELTPTTGGAPSIATPPKATAVEKGKAGYDFWRGDWFGDAGADFSYYNRFSNWIGYGQAHEGFRLFQFGPSLAFDAYAVENISWDARGDYFNNLIEIGPGLRWWWVPARNWAVVLRGEWLNGFYFGRDDRDTRGAAAGQYDDFRVGLSVGVTW